MTMMKKKKKKKKKKKNKKKKKLEELRKKVEAHYIWIAPAYFVIIELSSCRFEHMAASANRQRVTVVATTYGWSTRLVSPFGHSTCFFVLSLSGLFPHCYMF
jgi:hypothetical protein